VDLKADTIWRMSVDISLEYFIFPSLVYKTGDLYTVESPVYILVETRSFNLWEKHTFGVLQN